MILSPEEEQLYKLLKVLKTYIDTSAFFKKFLGQKAQSPTKKSLDREKERILISHLLNILSFTGEMQADIYAQALEYLNDFIFYGEESFSNFQKKKDILSIKKILEGLVIQKKCYSNLREKLSNATKKQVSTETQTGFSLNEELVALRDILIQRFLESGDLLDELPTDLIGSDFLEIFHRFLDMEFEESDDELQTNDRDHFYTLLHSLDQGTVFDLLNILCVNLAESDVVKTAEEMSDSCLETELDLEDEEADIDIGHIMELIIASDGMDGLDEQIKIIDHDVLLDILLVIFEPDELKMLLSNLGNDSEDLVSVLRNGHLSRLTMSLPELYSKKKELSAVLEEKKKQEGSLALDLGYKESSLLIRHIGDIEDDPAEVKRKLVLMKTVIDSLESEAGLLRAQRQQLAQEILPLENQLKDLQLEIDSVESIIQDRLAEENIHLLTPQIYLDGFELLLLERDYFVLSNKAGGQDLSDEKGMKKITLQIDLFKEKLSILHQQELLKRKFHELEINPMAQRTGEEEGFSASPFSCFPCH